MRPLSSTEAVDNLISCLLTSGEQVKSNGWQAQTVGSYSMVEVCDLFVRMRMVQNKEQLAREIKADLPWAEDHFMERISGEASNPGEQYKNWPYWRVDPKFMEGDIFSHTYQERFWPPKKEGIRYPMGDFRDILDRLVGDTTTRQAFLSIWHPEDQSNNDVRVPCTIGYWFSIRDGLLNISYLIRSCDARRHLRNDIYMTQRLAQEALKALVLQGHKVQLGVMSMWIGSLHCFTTDINYLKKK